MQIILSSRSYWKGHSSRPSVKFLFIVRTSPPCNNMWGGQVDRVRSWSYQRVQCFVIAVCWSSYQFSAVLLQWGQIDLLLCIIFHFCGRNKGMQYAAGCLTSILLMLMAEETGLWISSHIFLQRSNNYRSERKKKFWGMMLILYDLKWVLLVLV